MGWITDVICNIYFSPCAGVDEATIIEILTKRTNAQRQQIKAVYQQTKGKVQQAPIYTKLEFQVFLC